MTKVASREKLPRLGATRRQVIGAVLAAGAGVGVGMIWPARYIGRIYPGVEVLGLDFGGLSEAQAAARLDERLAPFRARAITFRLDDRTWTATAAELGIRVDVPATVDRAGRYGREGGFLQRFQFLGAAGHRAVIAPVVAVDQTVLGAYLDQLGAEVARAAEDARLTASGLTVTVSPGLTGVRLDRERTRQAVMQAVEQFAPVAVEVRVTEVAPRIAVADLERARAVAERAVAAPVAIAFGDRTWTLTPADLMAALVLPDAPSLASPSLDPDALRERLAPIATEVDEPPHDATVAWDGGLYVTSEGHAGTTVDLDRLVAKVAAAAFADERTVELPVTYSAPVVDASNLGALNVTTLLARGDSSFAGSTEARATNVAVAVGHIGSQLTPPGGICSFNASLGPITPEQGYVEGKIIRDNWFASDLGGGVCQVSTTVFRAALLAGLPFAVWRPHSFRVSFYELDGWSPGMDAVIYQPNQDEDASSEVDLQFVNPTDAWLLLQVSIVGETVIAEVYGAPTDYEVEVSDPVMSEPIPVPPPQERPNPELPEGVREQVQVAQEGLEVTVTRRVMRDGELVSEDTFFSPYQPQPAIFEVGAGETIADDAGHE